MSLHILGLPLTSQSVTDEFLEFIKQTNVILIQASLMYAIKEHNNDYVTARTGYDLLFAHDYVLTENMPVGQTSAHTIFAKQLWTKDRNCQLITQQVIDVYHELRQSNPDSIIAYITPGSPGLYDSIFKNLTNANLDISVIDTKSSAELAVEYLVSNKLIPDLEMNILNGHEASTIKSTIKYDQVNIIGCLGNIYHSDIKMTASALLSGISNNAKIFIIHLSDKIHVEKLTKIELIKQLITKRARFNSTLVVFVN
jgi:hypothetical protein